jgi:molybdate transport system substrate-binding protein
MAVSSGTPQTAAVRIGITCFVNVLDWIEQVGRDSNLRSRGTMAPPDKSKRGPLPVMCARALAAVANAVSPKFNELTGHDVDLTLGTVGALQARIDAGEIADVVILSTPAIGHLERAGKLSAGTRRVVGSTGIALAVRSGAPEPDISTVDAFKATLLGARSIAVSSPAVGGSAGVYLAALFERMGVVESLEKKCLRQQSGGDVARSVADGKAELGLTQLSEMLPVEGVTVVGALPGPIANDTVYCAAVRSDCERLELATAFIGEFSSPEARGLLTALGFRLPPLR